MLSARVAASEGALSCPATPRFIPVFTPGKTYQQHACPGTRGCSFRAAALSEFGCSSRVWRDPCSQRCALPHSSLGSKQCCSAAGLRVRLLPGAEPCRPPPPSLRRTVRHAQLEPRTVNDPSMPAPLELSRHTSGPTHDFPSSQICGSRRTSRLRCCPTSRRSTPTSTSMAAVGPRMLTLTLATDPNPNPDFHPNPLQPCPYPSP